MNLAARRRALRGKKPKSVTSFEHNPFLPFLLGEQRLTAEPLEYVDGEASPTRDDAVSIQADLPYTSWQMSILRLVGNLMVLLARRDMHTTPGIFFVNIRSDRRSNSEGLREARDALQKMSDTNGEGGEDLGIAVGPAKDDREWMTAVVDTLQELIDLLKQNEVDFHTTSFFEQVSIHCGCRTGNLMEPKRQHLAAVEREVGRRQLS